MTNSPDIAVPLFCFLAVAAYSIFYSRAFNFNAMFVLYPVLLGLMYRSPDVVLFPAIILLVFLLSIPNAYVFFGSFPGQLRAFAAGSNLPLIAFFAYWLIISLETGLAEPDVSYVTGGLPTLASLDMFMWAFGAILVSPLLGTLNLLAYRIFFRANT